MSDTEDFNPKQKELEAEIFGHSDDELPELNLDMSDDDDRGYVDENDTEKVDRTISKIKSIKRKGSFDNDSGEKQKKKKKHSSRADDDEEEEESKPIDPNSKEARIEEARKDFEAALNALKPRRAKKYDGMDAEIDEMIIRMREKMEDAAIKDINFNNNKQPAIAKLRLLHSIKLQLEKTHLHEQLLQNDILKGIKSWLEPLPDGSLPSLDIQRDMFEILEKLPVSTQDLTVSGVGRVLPFYAKCSRVIPEIKRSAENLITKWSRPILNRSDNYRTKQINTVDYDPNEKQYNQKPVAKISSVNTLDVLQRKPVEEDNRFRARIPQAVLSNYQVAPRSSFISTEKQKSSDRLKRLKNKFQKKPRAKSKVSVDGK